MRPLYHIFHLHKCIVDKLNARSDACYILPLRFLFDMYLIPIPTKHKQIRPLGRNLLLLILHHRRPTPGSPPGYHTRQSPRQNGHRGWVCGSGAGVALFFAGAFFSPMWVGFYMCVLSRIGILLDILPPTLAEAAPECKSLSCHPSCHPS